MDRITAERLERLNKLGLIRNTVSNRKGRIVAANMWVRPGENILTRMGQQAYSYKEKLDIFRVWKLMRISETDRPVFQTSITDHLIFVDPETGAKRQAA